MEKVALEEVIRCHKIESENCFFWSTHQQAGLDLLLFHKGKRLGFEFKYADTAKLTKSMHIACQDLKLDKLTVIYPGNLQYQLTETIHVVGLFDFLESYI